MSAAKNNAYLEWMRVVGEAVAAEQQSRTGRLGELLAHLQPYTKGSVVNNMEKG